MERTFCAPDASPSVGRYEAAGCDRGAGGFGALRLTGAVVRVWPCCDPDRAGSLSAPAAPASGGHAEAGAA
eukprot:scaffold28900_cov90-Isochrysis_galbana.AAC.1